jgi:LacI family transcriptional regulator
MTTIAEKCEVTHATVSNVLRNKPGTRVSPQTRERIFRLAVASGYQTRPDQRIDSHKRHIGMIFLDLQEAFQAPTFFRTVLMQLKMREESYKFDVQLYACERKDLDRTLYKAICEDQADALLLSRYGNARMINELAARISVPLVYAEHIEGLDCSSLGNDAYDLGKIAAEHLYSRGYRKFASFGGAYLGFGRRLAGFLETLEQLGVPRSEVLILDRALNAQGGAAMAGDLMSRNIQEPVGVFCHFDQIAFGAIQAFHDAGFPLAGRVGIIGSDNTEFGLYSHPSLTTIDLDAPKYADIVLEMLTRTFAGGPPEHQIIPPVLVARQSTVLKRG